MAEPPPERPQWADTLRRAIAKEEDDIAAEVQRVKQAAPAPRRPRGRVTRSELFGLKALQDRMRERHQDDDPA